jgi:hypothetical protein
MSKCGAADVAIFRGVRQFPNSNAIQNNPNYARKWLHGASRMKNIHSTTGKFRRGPDEIVPRETIFANACALIHLRKFECNFTANRAGLPGS